MMAASGSPTGSPQEVVAVDLQGRSEVITHVRSLPFSIDWLPDGPLMIASGRSILAWSPIARW